MVGLAAREAPRPRTHQTCTPGQVFTSYDYEQAPCAAPSSSPRSGFAGTARAYLLQYTRYDLVRCLASRVTVTTNQQVTQWVQVFGEDMIAALLNTAEAVTVAYRDADQNRRALCVRW